MIGAVCGGFLFLGGIFLLISGLIARSDWLFILGCISALVGLVILINELYYYYRERSRPIEHKGDANDD